MVEAAVSEMNVGLIKLHFFLEPERFGCWNGCGVGGYVFVFVVFVEHVA